MFSKKVPTSVDDRSISSAYAVNISIFSLRINHLTLRKYLPSMPSKGCLWDPVSRLWQLIEAWQNTDTMTPWPASRINGFDWNSYFGVISSNFQDHVRRSNHTIPNTTHYNRKVSMVKVNYLTNIRALKVSMRNSVSIPRGTTSCDQGLAVTQAWLLHFTLQYCMTMQNTTQNSKHHLTT